MKTLGKFEILERIGQGAMGVVYKARDPLIGRLVALKTITTGLAEDPAQLERFYHEAHSAGALQHPNIVTIYELGEEDHTPFIAMEYLSGQSLDKLIQSRRNLPLSQRIGFVAYVCRALAYAHKQGVVHRDIKPANVMVTADGAVKVVDFGIARIAETSRSQTGVFIGSLGYMSPQLVEGDRADARSDIWAAGIVFYELLAARRPFDGENYGAVMQKILKRDVPPLSETAPGTPPEVIDVVDLMLRKEVEERFQSMEEVLISLEPVWRRQQHAEIAGLLEGSRKLLEEGDAAKAYEMVRRVLQIDTANAAAKDLLEQVNAELRRNRTLPSPPPEKILKDDETLIVPEVAGSRPSPPGTRPPTASLAQKATAQSKRAADSVQPLRTKPAPQPAVVQPETLPPPPAPVALPLWKRPISIAFLILLVGLAAEGAYFLGTRRQNMSPAGTPVAAAASVSNTTPKSDADHALPPVSEPARGSGATESVVKQSPPATVNLAEGNTRVSDSAKKNLDTNPPTHLSHPPAAQAPLVQGGAVQVAGQATTPPAQERTEVAANNPAPPPPAEPPSQPAAIRPQPVVAPPSQPPSIAATPAAKAAEPAPASKAVEAPVASSAPPDNLDRQAITVSLQQLSAAFSHRSVSELEELWPKLPKDDKNTYKRAFDSAKSISRQFHLQSLNISNDGGLATAIGAYEGTVQDSRGVTTPNSGNFYVRFAKKNGRWYIDEARF